MRGPAVGRIRAFLVWAALASFGLAIGVLALLRNFEREGAGGRWRRAHAGGDEVDALLQNGSPGEPAQGNPAAE